MYICRRKISKAFPHTTILILFIETYLNIICKERKKHSGMLVHLFNLWLWLSQIKINMVTLWLDDNTTQYINYLLSVL